MAKNSSNQDSAYLKGFERKEDLARNHYFDNERVEYLMHKYVEGACTDVKLRDEIMTHASELIRQIIKAHNLGQICPGKDDASRGDLFQIAWLQIESALYKYKARPHCNKTYNKQRPNDSLISEQELFTEEIKKKFKSKCPICGDKLSEEHIYFKGQSKVFNLWCVAPDTQVITDSGIKDIGNSLDINNLFHGLYGMKKINAYVRKPKQKTLKINTMYNYDIEASPEHYLMKLCDSGPDWTQMKDLSRGDFVGIQCSQQYFVGDDSLHDVKSDWNSPDLITDELAYLFGLYVAEGSYGRNIVNIYNTDIDVMEALQDNSLGLKFAYCSASTANYTCNKAFRQFLENIGFCSNHRAHTKIIPEKLLKMSKDNINALLSGLFDGDGHSSRYNGEVGLTSCSIKLIKQVRMLLLNIGIISKISTDRREIRQFIKRCGKKFTSDLRDAYLLRLSSVDSLRFYDRIGFRIKRKQTNISNVPMPRDVIYCVGDKFRRLYNKYGSVGHYNDIRRMVNGANRITARKAITMLGYWGEYDSDPDYQFISDRINEYYRFMNRIIWLPIIDISESESEVCDVEISSEDHSYIANGFISHNSQIARTVGLAYIKKENRDRKNSSVFQDHLENRSSTKNEVLTRFLNEARDICKYNGDHLTVVRAIEQLFHEDIKPHEGLIGKLVERTQLPRSTITNFLRILRLRAQEFTDSPVNDEQQKAEADDKDPE